jgi:ferredoxin-NADP reductase
VATVAAVRVENPTVHTLVLDVPDWPGHVAGQHVDVRLTAEDGYSTQRSYSLASADPTVEITVQRLVDGEVSPYLVDAAAVGDQFELRGPVGGYFTWSPRQTEPVLLVAGGSGIAPLMAMIRSRSLAGSRVPFRLVYSVRDPESVIYGTELAQRLRDARDFGLDVTYVYTRATPPEWRSAPGRLSAETLAAAGWPADFAPACYVCGPTGFVETVADLLVAAGHEPARVKTERFGG